jgi:hypothetical protein
VCGVFRIERSAIFYRGLSVTHDACLMAALAFRAARSNLEQEYARPPKGNVSQLQCGRFMTETKEDKNEPTASRGRTSSVEERLVEQEGESRIGEVTALEEMWALEEMCWIEGGVERTSCHRRVRSAGQSQGRAGASTRTVCGVQRCAARLRRQLRQKSSIELAGCSTEP